jgi:hypothetical protein
MRFDEIAKRAEPEPTKTWLARTVVEGLEAFRAGSPTGARGFTSGGRPAQEIVELAAELDADQPETVACAMHHRAVEVHDAAE